MIQEAYESEAARIRAQNEKLAAESKILKDTIQVITIYGHNVSGAESKIANINNSLAVTDFDIVCLQETWWNGTVIDDEIIGGTSYRIVRSDHSCFMNSRRIGGGLVTILHQRLDYEQISIAKTSIECHVIRMKSLRQCVYLFNVYIVYADIRPQSTNGYG